MDTPATSAADYPTLSADMLASMPAHTFLAAWRAITGEPPAIMLSSHAAMIALLVASIPMAPFEPPIPGWDGRRTISATAR